MTSSTNSLRGKIGAYALHAAYDSKEITKPARAKFMARFEEEVDPEGSLSQAERERRAGYAKKRYFAQLALKSAKARQSKGRRKIVQDPPQQGNRFSGLTASGVMVTEA